MDDPPDQLCPLLSRWDIDAHGWRLADGPYDFSAGADAGDRPPHAVVDLDISG